MVMKGYWNQPGETAAALVDGQWLRTGDAAYLDAQGYIFLFDRFKDMIISGGENIYPAEIENVLNGHPAVREVAVIGVPHAKWGETPRAVVVLRPGQHASEPELIDFTRERLAHYKCPTSVAFAQTLPRNASGKLLKRELRRLQAAKSGGAP
jgi:long-chain acyl-CoA synthetase